MKLLLPPRKLIPRPNHDDPLPFYYIPFVGYVYKKRLVNTLKLLGFEHENLIDVGFGSGLLFLELNKRAQNIFGVDIHDKIGDVIKMLESLKITAELKQGSIYQMPYADNFFDAAVSVSAFEHLKDLDAAFRELFRILKPGGRAVISFPVRNIITDTFFRAVGFNPRQIHPSGHRDIIEAAGRYFTIEETLIFPKFIPIDLSLYCSILCRREG